MQSSTQTYFLWLSSNNTLRFNLERLQGGNFHLHGTYCFDEGLILLRPLVIFPHGCHPRLIFHFVGVSHFLHMCTVLKLGYSMSYLSSNCTSKARYHHNTSRPVGAFQRKVLRQKKAESVSRKKNAQIQLCTDIRPDLPG